jgi:hypothetical protein
LLASVGEVFADGKVGLVGIDVDGAHQEITE